MTDLQRMILAARQIGEVVAKPLLDDLDQHDLQIGKISVPTVLGTFARMHDNIALDLLTARVWRAVQGWADVFNYAWSWFYIRKGSREFEFRHLPSAVAAIHKHWKESHNA